MIKESRRKVLAPGLAALAAVIILIVLTLCFVWEVHRKSRVQFP